MSVYVNLAGCTRPIDVIYRIEAALVAAEMHDLADWYRKEMRDLHPNTPDMAAAHRPDCVTFSREEVELEARVLATEGGD